MAQKPSIPKGTRDFSPEEVVKRSYIMNIIKDCFTNYGYQPIETPSFEKSETLMGKYGEEGDRLIFKILNSGDFFRSFDKYRKEISRLLLNLSLKILSSTKDDFNLLNEIYLYRESNENYDYRNSEYIRIRLKIYQTIEPIIRKSVLPSDKLFGTNLEIAIKSILKRKKIIFSNIEDLVNSTLDYEKNQDLIDRKYSRLSNNITKELFDDVKFLNSEISEKALRYDLTVPFARYVVQHQNEITFPFKRYQIQPVWRADRPQKGRFREFFQCDADVVGSTSLWQEVELVQLYDDVFNKLNLKGVTVKLNNRKILSGIAPLPRTTL